MKDHYWMGISDFMTALMMLFLLISLSYMLQADREGRQIREVEEALHQETKRNLEKFLDSWHAEIAGMNIVRFTSPEILFSKQGKEIKPLYQEILKDFFPMYLSIINSPIPLERTQGETFRKYVQEIRIEGYTSTEWKDPASLQTKGYVFNLNLSQQRSLSVLRFCMKLPNPIVERNQVWLIDRLRADGQSFSKIIGKDNREYSFSEILADRDKENPDLSRRVDFRMIVGPPASDPNESPSPTR